MEPDNYKNSCGKIDQFFNLNQLNNFVQIFKKVDSNNGEGNDCYGIDQNHLAYPWLKTSLLQPIAEQFNPDLKLIFAMLLNCVEPFPIHNDIKEIPEKNGQHFLSFLIPYSVDNDISKCSHASTLIFNESYNQVRDHPPYDIIENNASDLFEEKISHVPKETTYAVSLKEELIWSPGDLCWWDSQLLHVSNNFIKDGFSSKQGIVIHTYVL